MYILGERGSKKRERERGKVGRAKGKDRGRYKALIVDRTLCAMYARNVHIIRTVIGDVIDYLVVLVDAWAGIWVINWYLANFDDYQILYIKY